MQRRLYLDNGRTIFILTEITWLHVETFSGTSELFVTSSFQDIRVWSQKDNNERLRIVVPNMTCNAIEVLPNGLAIISGKLHIV